MKLKIEIELNNDTFKNDNALEEVDRLLTDIASRVPEPLAETNGEFSLHDANGNWVGYARIEPGTIRTKRWARLK